MTRLTEKGKYSEPYESKSATECINKLGKLEDLEEEIGCPLDVRCNVYTGVNVFDKEKRKYSVTYTYENGFITNKNGYQFYFYWSDHKKTWWLKEDMSE